MENYINFDFYIPTRIIFQKGALENLPLMEEVKNRRLWAAQISGLFER